MYGGFRPGNNLFAASLIALDVKTGKRLWHYQMVHHDVWNYDTSTAPIVMDVNVGGRRIPGVFQATKQAILYAFNRQTGEPIWGFQERPVPRVEGARREALADAAVPDQAGAVRVHRAQRRTPDRLHAADQGARAQARGRTGPVRAAVQSADPSRQRGERGTGAVLSGRDRRHEHHASAGGRSRRPASSTFRRTAAASQREVIPGKELDCFGQTGTTVTAWVPTSAGCTPASVEAAIEMYPDRGAEGGRGRRAEARSWRRRWRRRRGGRGGAGTRRRAGGGRSAGRAAALQGTGRPHHRDRPEHRRAPVGDAERRCAAGTAGRHPQPSAAQGRQRRTRTSAAPDSAA